MALSGIQLRDRLLSMVLYNVDVMEREIAGLQTQVADLQKKLGIEPVQQPQPQPQQ